MQTPAKCFKFGLKKLGTHNDVGLKTGFHDYLKHFEQENCMPFKKQHGAKAVFAFHQSFLHKTEFNILFTCKFLPVVIQ